MLGMMRTSERAAEPAGSGGLEALYVAHAPAALRLAYYLSGDREQARDLVQDAFVRVAGRFAYLRNPDVFETYLRRTIVNLHTSRLRGSGSSAPSWPGRRGGASRAAPIPTLPIATRSGAPSLSFRPASARRSSCASTRT